MRIAYVCESVLPSRTANSIQVVRMCEAFAAEGHEVVLLAPRRHDGQEGAIEDVPRFYGVRTPFRIETHAWPALPYRAVIFALAVARAIGRLRPDLVYSRSLHSGLIPAARGYRVMLEAHAPVWEYSRLVAAAVRRLAARGRIHRVVTVTDALAQKYVEQGCVRREQILVAPNGALPPHASGTAQSAAAARPSPARHGALQAGYVGQLYPGKGMEVIARIAPRVPDVDFHVIGGMEPDVARWRDRVRGANVHFHGFVPQSDVAGLIARLDVGLLPNQKHVAGHERAGGRAIDLAGITSPLKMFEYMAHGKAIVCSDLPVLREVMNERNAILVGPEDDDGWVAAIRRLADPAVRKVIAMQAQRDFEEHYTLRARARTILAAAG